MGFLGYLCAGENEISSNRRPYPAFLTQEDIPLKTGMGLNWLLDILDNFVSN